MARLANVHSPYLGMSNSVVYGNALGQSEES